MAWRFDGHLMVVVHGPKNPSNLEWQRMLKDEVEHGRDEHKRTLIVSYGGGPDGEQRKVLARQMNNDSGPTCIMTRSALVKAIASALLYFNRRMKVVGLGDRQSAYDFLGLSSDERTTADRARAELEAQLGLSIRSREPPSAR